MRDLGRKEIHEIAGEIAGPFYVLVTYYDVNKGCLSISTEMYQKFFKRFFPEDGGQVTLYHIGEGTTAEYLLTLKSWRSKYILNGETFTRFSRDHPFLMQVGGIVKLWAFRHAENGKICAAITSRTGFSMGASSSSSQKAAPPPLRIKERDTVRSHLAHISRKRRGPLEHVLSHADVKEKWLSLSRANYEKILKPFFWDGWGDGAKITLYHLEERARTEYHLILKQWGSKWVLYGDDWKKFCLDHTFMIKVSAVVKMWTWRNLENQRICVAMTSGTGDSLASSAPLPMEKKLK